MEITKDNLHKAIAALRQCAKENKGKQTDTGSIIVSDLCTDVADYLESIFRLADSLSTEEEIKKRFDIVQDILDTLQNSDATFMFIGHEGNHFILSGNTTNISAQIMFAMMRYPIVRDIIKTCASRYDELNEEHGDKARNIKMDHLIEKNSGNKGN